MSCVCVCVRSAIPPLCTLRDRPAERRAKLRHHADILAELGIWWQAAITMARLARPDADLLEYVDYRAVYVALLREVHRSSTRTNAVLRACSQALSHAHHSLTSSYSHPHPLTLGSPSPSAHHTSPARYGTAA